jgi:adenosylcobinamide-phosphate synthase
MFQFPAPPLLAPWGPEPLLVLLIALALDAGLGDWGPANRARALPAAPWRALAAEADRRLNRTHRPAATRRARGAVATALAAALALAAGLGLGALARALPYGWAIELWLLLAAVSLRGPWRWARAAGGALAARDGAAAREALGALSPRAAWELDDHGVARAAIEALARALHRRFLAPVFWYALGGLPGLLLWHSSEAMDRAFGHGTGRHRDFGAAAARLAGALDWIPARAAALAAAAAALFVATARPWPALRTALAEGSKPMGEGSAWPAAAFAGALGLSLGGPRREGEVVVRAPWIGDGRARAEAADLRRALLLFVASSLVAMAAFGALALVPYLIGGR